MDADQEIDTRGTKGPVTILRANVVLLSMQPGQVLRVHSDDANAAQDFAAYAKATGHELVGNERNGDVVVTFIKHK